MMIHETPEHLPEDLKILDSALGALAERSAPPSGFLGRVEKTLLGGIPGPRVITMPREESAPRPRAGRRNLKILLSLAAVLVALLGIHAFTRSGLGTMEFRSGLAAVIRSGKLVSQEQAAQIRAGDVLETRDGSLAALLDNRVQVLMNKGSMAAVAGKKSMNLQSGEVWIYVIPGSGPWTVHTPGGDIHVVGTSFGVQATDNAVIVTVSSGTVLFRIGSEDVEIGAGQRMVLQNGLSLSQAEKTSNPSLRRPPEWVEHMVEEISEERLRRFFPSAAPVDNEVVR
ncbi:MAG TPA: FecR family protein [Candidatus Sumerlaeota bacterium]|nr:FecR family protein [Candidatus Sumerlaeota bacterium]